MFSERDVIQPHTGEVVAVYDEKDGHWYRARVIDSNVGSITVCTVNLVELIVDSVVINALGIFCGLWKYKYYFG